MNACHLFVKLYTCLVFKQKTAYEMRISDWSSDVCSSDLREFVLPSGEVAIIPEQWFTQFVNFFYFAEGNESLRLKKQHVGVINELRSEERRVGKECVSPCRSRWSPNH